MAFLSLKSDFIFRVVFTKSKNSLISLLNAVLELDGDHRIKDIEIQNPELPKDILSEKTSILDIKAQDQKGRFFHVEMQVFPQESFPKRVLYYWSKLYNSQLLKGQPYESLQKVYSVNFIDFNLIESHKFKSSFLLLEKDDPNIQLTDVLEIVFIELKKFTKPAQKVIDEQDAWLYVIQNTQTLTEQDMRILVDKAPVLDETFDHIKKASLDPKLFSIEEMRLTAQREHASFMSQARREGIEKGRAEGIEKGKIETAKAMLEKGFALSEISEITGLSVETIQSLN